jgi:hypothetical protein
MNRSLNPIVPAPAIDIICLCRDTPPKLPEEDRFWGVRVTYLTGDAGVRGRF